MFWRLLEAVLLAIKKEPILFGQSIQQGIGLLVLFGINISPEAQAGILAFVGTVIAFIVRTAVTSNVNVETTTTRP